jgi:hypothetical protein
MIVAIHQPHFLPWLGYLERMKRADLFIVLDHVQFERGNYQNRTQYLMEGEKRWLTVPVEQNSYRETILEKRIKNTNVGQMRWWGPNHFQTLRHAYRRAPYFERYSPWLQEIFERRWDRLAELNEALLEFLRDAFDISTPLVKSSQLQIEGARSELVFNLCRAVGADTFLAGDGGSRTYLDRAAFEAGGIDVQFQNFRHPRYPQAGMQSFVPGLSAIDLLFNVGIQSRALLAPPASPVEDALAAA